MLRTAVQHIRSAFDRNNERSLYRTAGSKTVELAFESLSRAGRLDPRLRPDRHGLEVVRNIPYLDDGSPAHLLDVYTPIRARRPMPIVMYVHGGGFRILSKDSHWPFGVMFGRKGYLVFNVNYRLAPAHPFPAAIEDTCAAYRWVVAHAERYGGDSNRIVVAGESAGGNLVTSLAMTTSIRRHEPYARETFDTAVTPKAVWAACGLHQVTQPDRFWRDKPMSQLVRNRIEAVCNGYLPQGGSRDPVFFANPLPSLEGGVTLDRPMPPFYLSAGTGDPIEEDTRRLEAVLRKMGVPCEARYDHGEPHAYQAMLWKASTKALWRSTHQFLERHV